MDRVYWEVNNKIAQTYGVTEIPSSGSVVVEVSNKYYVGHFYKKETGWGISKIEEIKRNM